MVFPNEMNGGLVLVLNKKTPEASENSETIPRKQHKAKDNTFWFASFFISSVIAQRGLGLTLICSVL